MKINRTFIPILLLVLSFLLIANQRAGAQGSKAPSQLLNSPAKIYEDKLMTNWRDWSWDTSRNFSNPTPAQAGAASISVRIDRAWGALYLHSQRLQSTTGYTHLEFYIHGGANGGQKLNVIANRNTKKPYPLTVSANTWTKVVIPLESLGSPRSLIDLYLQDAAGKAQSRFYVDNVALVDNGSNQAASATPTLAAPTQTATRPAGTIAATQTATTRTATAANATATGVGPTVTRTTAATVVPTTAKTPTLPPPPPTATLQAPTPTAPPATNFSFMETFDGEPSSPQPFQSPNWDVSVHSRNIETWERLESMHAMHGADCSAPPATHTVTEYSDAVFLCKNHMMTAINASGYGVIYLTPNRMVDFSNGEAVIRFDLSTFRASKRDWIDVWIAPYDDQLQLPLTDFYPDLSGEPQRAIHLEMDQFNGNTTFKLSRISNFNAQLLSGNTSVGYESFLTPDSARRDTFELRISRNHIKFGMPAYNFWWFDTDIPNLDWTSGIVQFGHHSYTPTKDCNNCGPNTWHWDNIGISSSSPFTIIHSTQRYTDAGNGAKISLASAAPANANLRFAGIGKSIQVSFDNGATWVVATAQDQEKRTEEAFWSYWMPIPEGTQTILFKGENWWGGGWRVKDLSVWVKP